RCRPRAERDARGTSPRGASRRPRPAMGMRRRPSPGRPRSAKREAGFTLIEIVIAMVLLGAIMVLLYGGLTFALRSWDAADANGRRVADRRLAETFLRREVAEIVPLRWKDATSLRFAFE